MLAILLALVKAVPAADDLAKQFVAAYVAWKREQNLKDENAKNSRDDAIIDGLSRGVPKLCPDCPFAGDSGRQHGAIDATPPISGGGAGRT